MQPFSADGSSPDRHSASAQPAGPRQSRRPFGHTGLMLPPVVFGTTNLGNLFVAPSAETKRELIRSWFRQFSGPIAIDTAGKYGAGLALEVLGRELRNLGIDADDVVISNKLGWRRVPLRGDQPTFEPGVWIDLKHDAVQAIGREGILRCWDEAAETLRPFRQQLVSVHDPDEYLQAAASPADREHRLGQILDAYHALERLREAGDVRGVGVGAKDWRVIEELDRHCQFDWVMLANSLTIMRHPPELLRFVESLAAKGVAIINSAVTHGGFLTGGSFLDYRKLDASDPVHSEAIRWRGRYQQVCAAVGVSPYDAAVAFGAAHPAVNAVAVSTSRPERVGAMVSAASEPVPPRLWDALRQERLISVVFS